MARVYRKYLRFQQMNPQLLMAHLYVYSIAGSLRGTRRMPDGYPLTRYSPR
jgi:hypothetical protein